MAARASNNGSGQDDGVSTVGAATNAPGILRQPQAEGKRNWSDIPHVLPHEKVFPIQIGSELFRLSGASISSDG